MRICSSSGRSYIVAEQVNVLENAQHLTTSELKKSGHIPRLSFEGAKEIATTSALIILRLGDVNDDRLGRPNERAQGL